MYWPFLVPFMILMLCTFLYDWATSQRLLSTNPRAEKHKPCGVFFTCYPAGFASSEVLWLSHSLPRMNYAQGKSNSIQLVQGRREQQGHACSAFAERSVGMPDLNAGLAPGFSHVPFLRRPQTLVRAHKYLQKCKPLPGNRHKNNIYISH